MPRQNASLLAFNRGLVSPKALARVDLERMAFSAETQNNWMPRSLGSMTLRPGLGFLGSTNSDNKAYFREFIFATDDTALMEFTDLALRIWVSDALVTRTTVTAAVTNGGFDSDVASWTDSDESGGVSTWKTGGYLSLIGNATNFAIRRQQVTVTETGTEHALDIVVENGPVTLFVGSSAGASDYISTSLGKGSHSISFTPTGDFHIDLKSNLLREVLVDSINVASAGVMSLTTTIAAADLPNIRLYQSADVVYIAISGKKQKQIERRGTTSWSIVDYDHQDGPFDVINVTTTTIASSALSGNVTLTASKDLFLSSHVGALFRMDSIGQSVASSITAENVFTDNIKVTGTGTARGLAISITGTWVATVTLQRSIGAPGTWTDVEAYTTNTSKTFNDGLSNQEIYYRVGVKTGDFTSGTVEAAMDYSGGTAVGVVRILTVASSVSAGAEVLDALGSTDATDLWYEGLWSDRLGYPSTVSIAEGRLWWAGKGRWFGSVSDGYTSFDLDVEGDSGPIIRQIGFGPVDTSHWMLPLQRLILGTTGSEISARSSSFDEPLTPTNFNMKDPSTQGSAMVDATRMDSRGFFVQRNGRRLVETVLENLEYQPKDTMLLVPDLAESDIVKIAVQRQPDTRIHAVLEGGTAMVYITDPAEEISAWVTVETDGTIEDVVVLPGTSEDFVYYVVNRTSGRYLEKWAFESECIGGTLNKQADSFITGTGQVIATAHLTNGDTVVAWGDGVYIGEFTVASLQVDLGASYTSVVLGLGYTASFKSAKLAYAAALGSALTQKKRVSQLGLILKDTHILGVKYGSDAAHLDNLPKEYKGGIDDDDTIYESYDVPSFAFNGTWDSDSRIYLQAQAPFPVTVLAAVPTVITHEKS